MANIKQVTKEVLKTLVTLSEYNSKEVEYATNLAETIQAAGVNVSLLFEVEYYEGEHHFRHYVILLNEARKDLKLQIMKRDTDKQYSIFSYNQYEYCENSQCHEIKQKSGLIEPQGIGVITTKKVKAWVDYQTALHDMYITRAAENKAEIDAFLREVKEYENYFAPLKEHDIYSNGVRWYKDGISGYIKNNGLEFSFQCYKGSGFIEKKIKITAGNNLENFIQLSDNKYTPGK